MTESVTRLQKWPFLRYLAAGALNTVVTYVLFLALSSVLHYSVAYTIAFLVGIALSYALAATFVFGTGFALRSALRFPFVYVAQYLFGLAGLFLLIDVCGMPRQAAILAVIAMSVPLTYLLMRYAMKPGTSLTDARGWRDDTGADDKRVFPRPPKRVT